MNNIQFDNAIGFTISTGLKAGCSPYLMLASLELHAQQLKNKLLASAQAAAEAPPEAPKIVPANGAIFPKRG